MRAGGFNIGGEQSGHLILADHSTTGDGLVAALQVLAAVVAAGKPASEVLHQFDAVPQLLKSVRFTGKPLESDTVKAVIADAEARLNGAGKGGGRLLIRKSGTEPVIRVMAEGDDKALVKAVVEEICAAVVAA
jgi:phosphoglucosamine mutase